MNGSETLAMAEAFGIRIRTSRALPGPNAEIFYADWRERLTRNLTRPSTGKWEPLSRHDDRPNVFLIGDELWMNPRTVAAIKVAP